VSGTLKEFLKLNFTLTSNKDPEINSKFSFSTFILDRRLLVSAFILLETKSTSPKNIFSLKLDNLTSTGRPFFIDEE
jgi:hypothetical protein